MHKKLTRKGSPPIKVWCLPEERSQIEALAASAGLSLSAYLRRVGMGHRVGTVLDHRRVDEMARISGDLGRLGGLLKLWLANDEKLAQFDARQLQQTILGVLQRIGQNQARLLEVMQAVVRSRPL